MPNASVSAKIFISHSSRDKWAARRIADDLVALGARTFLDEKDIETGESIDAAIHEHLHDSDDFLILLTPYSLKSEWVLIELGGALALRKNVVPVMLYVSVNEIPKIISLKLARDISDIQKYYDEVSTRLGKGVSAPKRKPHRRRSRQAVHPAFNVGDLVQIVKPKRPELAAWTEYMDNYAGMKTRIESLIGSGQSVTAYKLEVDGGDFWWLPETLLPVETSS